jgi:hypothetical protein
MLLDYTRIMRGRQTGKQRESFSCSFSHELLQEILLSGKDFALCAAQGGTLKRIKQPVLWQPACSRDCPGNSLWRQPRKGVI